MAARTHHYELICSWNGSSARGYSAYDRGHDIAAPGVEVPLRLSADHAFFGDASRFNPELLVVAGASSCQLLSFLACCAREQVDVVSYEDHASAEMPEDDPPVRLASIRLAPRITVMAPARIEQVRELCARAHEECYVAASLSCPVVLEPVVDVLEHRA